MSTVPSHLYPGLDPETVELQGELDLDGGDNRATNLDLHVVIDDLRGRLKSRILWQLDEFIGLKDPLSPEQSTASSMSYYRVSSVHTISELLSKNNEKTLHSELCEWALDGFNACAIGYGARESGKTLTMFGPSTLLTKFPKSISRNILEYIYARKRSLDLKVGISCWALKNNGIIDLCSNTKDKTERHEFVIIECDDEAMANLVLHAARLKCGGVEASNNSRDFKEHEKAHFFLRITIWRNEKPHGSTDHHGLSRDAEDMGKISHIDLVDLIGTCAASDDGLSFLTELDKEARLEINAQHLSFVKLLQDMKIISQEANEQEPSLLSSPLWPKTAPICDSQLTKLLLPLIQGNAKISLLLFMQDHEKYFKHCKSALSAFKDVREIATICNVTPNIKRNSVVMQRQDNLTVPPRPPLLNTTERYSSSLSRDRVEDVSTTLIDLLSPIKGRKEEIKVDALMGEFNELMADIGSICGLGHDLDDLDTTNLGVVTEEAYYQNDVDVCHEHLRSNTSSFDRNLGGEGDATWTEKVSFLSHIHTFSLNLSLFQQADSGELTLLSLAAEPDADLYYRPLQGQVSSAHVEQDMLTGRLSRTNENLLEALYKEQQDRLNAESITLQLKDDLLEVKTAHEVQLDEFRLENIRLKTKLRQISMEKGITDIYLSFEDDLHRLTSENETLRRRNLSLEEKYIEFDESVTIKAKSSINRVASSSQIKPEFDKTFANGIGVTKGIDVSFSEKFLTEETQRIISTMRAKLRTISRDNLVLKDENEKLRKQERFSLISDRLNTENQKRIRTLNEEFRKIQKNLELEKETTRRQEQELVAIKACRSHLEDTEDVLKTENKHLKAELASLQRRLMDAIEDKKNINKLARFIEKHAPISKSPETQPTISNMKVQKSEVSQSLDGPFMLNGRDYLHPRVKFDVTGGTRHRKSAFGTLMSLAAEQQGHVKLVNGSHEGNLHPKQNQAWRS